MNVKLAGTLWTNGAGHAAAARILTEEARRDAKTRGKDPDALAFNGMLSASTHLLIGYAFELLLKSAFLHLGGQQEQLKMIGHDLVQAFDAAARFAFVSTNSGLRGILEGIRDPHRINQFRYGGPDIIMMPTLDVTLQAVDDLAREVGALVNGWSAFTGAIHISPDASRATLLHRASS